MDICRGRCYNSRLCLLREVSIYRTKDGQKYLFTSSYTSSGMPSLSMNTLSMSWEVSSCGKVTSFTGPGETVAGALDSAEQVC